MAIYLLIGVAFGIGGAAIGSNRKVGPVAGFFLGFLLGLIGIVILLCLSKPDLRPRMTYEPVRYQPGALDQRHQQQPGPYGQFQQPEQYGQFQQAPPPDLAGWHADPTHRAELRYHDGIQWTAHVSSTLPDGTQTQSEDPL